MNGGASIEKVLTPRGLQYADRIGFGSGSSRGRRRLRCWLRGGVLGASHQCSGTLEHALASGQRLLACLGTLGIGQQRRGADAGQDADREFDLDQRGGGAEDRNDTERVSLHRRPGFAKGIVIGLCCCGSGLNSALDRIGLWGGVGRGGRFGFLLGHVRFFQELVLNCWGGARRLRGGAMRRVNVDTERVMCQKRHSNVTFGPRAPNAIRDWPVLSFPGPATIRSGRR